MLLVGVAASVARIVVSKKVSVVSALASKDQAIHLAQAHRKSVAMLAPMVNIQNE